MTPKQSQDAARRVIALERDGLDRLAGSIDDRFSAVVDLVRGVKGRLICAGVGKSGHVARKIAATLASTGTPAQFVHPTEASHGDLGMITPEDAVLALSKSGETTELGDLMAYCRRFSTPLIAMTAGRDSMLARAADFHLFIPDAEEACGETRAPTTSTTLMMALGDALAVALIEARGFTAGDFKTYHPGGTLGAALLTVADLMHAGEDLPLTGEATSMGEAVAIMTDKGLGCVGVTGADGRLTGMITDGDIRRHIASDLPSRAAHDVMTRNPKTVGPETLAADALRLMTAGTVKITQLFVIGEDGKPLGLLHIHDLLKAGLK